MAGVYDLAIESNVGRQAAERGVVGRRLSRDRADYGLRPGAAGNAHT
jgi:hypothetical protein